MNAFLWARLITAFDKVEAALLGFGVREQPAALIAAELTFRDPDNWLMVNYLAALDAVGVDARVEWLTGVLGAAGTPDVALLLDMRAADATQVAVDVEHAVRLHRLLVQAWTALGAVHREEPVSVAGVRALVVGVVDSLPQVAAPPAIGVEVSGSEADQ
jgi:hypothetical protein